MIVKNQKYMASLIMKNDTIKAVYMLKKLKDFQKEIKPSLTFKKGLFTSIDRNDIKIVTQSWQCYCSNIIVLVITHFKN